MCTRARGCACEAGAGGAGARHCRQHCAPPRPPRRALARAHARTPPAATSPPPRCSRSESARCPALGARRDFIQVHCHFKDFKENLNDALKMRAAPAAPPAASTSRRRAAACARRDTTPARRAARQRAGCRPAGRRRARVTHASEGSERLRGEAGERSLSGVSWSVGSQRLAAARCGGWGYTTTGGEAGRRAAWQRRGSRPGASTREWRRVAAVPACRPLTIMAAAPATTHAPHLRRRQLQHHHHHHHHHHHRQR